MKKLIYITFLLLTFASQAQKKVTFSAPELYPEGVIYDSKNAVFYVSSARLGEVGKVTMAGKYTTIYSDKSLKSTYGMKLHPDGKRLFVCVSDANYSKFSALETYQVMARLISIDVKTGKKLSDVDLSKLVPSKHFANDLTFDNQGNAYVTDSYANVIYKIGADNKPVVFAKSDKFKTEGNGLNGIAFHPNGYLLVASSGKGCLFKVSLSNPQEVQMVTINQFFPGADGLLLNGNNLVLVQNGGVNKIFKLESTDDYKTARVVASTLPTQMFGFPSTATNEGQNVWVIDAKFNQLKEKNSVPAQEFTIQEAVFKSL